MTYSSILIVLGKNEEAKQVLEMGTVISSHFNLHSLQGKLQLMKLSIDIHDHMENENKLPICNQDMFTHIYKLFKKDGNSQGIRAMNCLQGVCKLKKWEHLRN